MPPSDDIEIGAPPPAGESTPLVRSDNDSDDDEPLEEIEDCTNKEKIVSGVAAVAAAVSVAAMAVESNPMVYLSGATGAVVAPYSAFQQQKITDTEALEETNERLEEEVGKLRAENDRLQSSVGQLEQSVENLKDLEDTLETIKKSETKSLDVLEKQVAQQREILNSMEGNLKATIMQNLVSTVLASDKDGDKMLCDEEIDLLINKIENLYDVELQEDKFKMTIIGAGRSLNAVMEVGRNLMDDSTPPEDRIFNLKGKW